MATKRAVDRNEVAPNREAIIAKTVELRADSVECVERSAINYAFANRNCSAAVMRGDGKNPKREKF